MFPTVEKMLDCLHDINNKLSIVIGNAMLLKRAKDNCRNSCGLVEQIADAGLAIGDIISSCRSSLAQEKAQELTRIDIHELLEGTRATEECKRLGTEFGLAIEIVNRLYAGCSVLVCHSSALESAKQFVHNILFNAKKAKSTKVRIVAVEHSEYVAIHFIDDGDGMSAETLACLGLSVASTTSTGEGTRIAKKLALQEGAVVDWSSPGMGAGVCVTLRMTKFKEPV